MNPADEEQMAERMGGWQLRAILEHHVNYESIVKSMYYFNIQQIDLICLKTWIDHRYSVREAIRALEHHYGITKSVRSMHDLFQATLRKIRPRIKVKPDLNEQGQVVNPIPFLKYDIFDIDDSPYRVVAMEVDMSKYWFDLLMASDQVKYEQIFIYRRKNGVWKPSASEFAKDYCKSYLQMKEWMKGSESSL